MSIENAETAQRESYQCEWCSSIFADTISSLTELLEKWDDSQLVQLTNYYRKGLEQAIEQTVEKVGLILIYERHFSGQEYEVSGRDG